MSHIDIFSRKYETCEWGTNKNTGYSGSSGSGSDVDVNKDTYVPFLRNLLTGSNITSVADLGCGDFRVGPLIYGDLSAVSYAGYDAYKGVIEYHREQHKGRSHRWTFTHLDIYNRREDILSADMCILKDVLQHWTRDEIVVMMDYLVGCGKFKYILICNCCGQRSDDFNNSRRSAPLSARYMPLAKYNPVILYRYSSKEVSLITC
jgi:SAM-dependent methyltransferase